MDRACLAEKGCELDSQCEGGETWNVDRLNAGPGVVRRTLKLKRERSEETNAHTGGTVSGIRGSNIFLKLIGARPQDGTNHKGLHLEPNGFAIIKKANRMETQKGNCRTLVCSFLQSRNCVECTSVIHPLQRSLQPVRTGRPSYHCHHHYPLQRHLHPSLRHLQGKVIPHPNLPPEIALLDEQGHFCP